MVYRPDEEADGVADGDWEQLDPEEAAAESRRLLGKMYPPRGRSPAVAPSRPPVHVVGRSPLDAGLEVTPAAAVVEGCD